MIQSEIRDLFPIMKHCVYLNNAAETPLNKRVETRLLDYMATVSSAPHTKASVRSSLRESLSRLLGGAAKDYALVSTTGVGMSIAAGGMTWQAGDNVVLPADEHWNTTFPWLALKDRGVEVRLVPVGVDQRIHLEDVAALTDQRTRVLVTTAVRFNTGFRADLKAWSRLARQHDALLVVDAIQGAGVVPIDVEADGVDVLCAAGFKWLLGMHGCGFIYVNERARKRIRPLMPGMFAAAKDFRTLSFHEDARKYETGNFAYAVFHAWLGGLALLEDVTISRVSSYVLELNDYLIAGLKRKGCSVVSPSDTAAERSAIVAFTVGDELQNEALHQALLARNVITAYRDGRIRVAPNFFNSEEDIDQLLAAL